MRTGVQALGPSSLEVEQLGQESVVWDDGTACSLTHSGTVLVLKFCSVRNLFEESQLGFTNILSCFIPLVFLDHCNVLFHLGW